MTMRSCCTRRLLPTTSPDPPSSLCGNRKPRAGVSQNEHPTTGAPMNLRLALAALILSAPAARADDKPPIPEKPIAVKKELLFSDDFEKAEPAKEWHKVVP